MAIFKGFLIFLSHIFAASFPQLERSRCRGEGEVCGAHHSHPGLAFNTNQSQQRQESVNFTPEKSTERRT